MSYHKKFFFAFLAASTLYCSAQQNERNEKLFCHTQRQDITTLQTAQPSMLVLNYSLQSNAAESHNSFRRYKLSTHYIIDKDGKFYKGMSEDLEEIPTIEGNPIIDPEFIKKRAWHTGVGYWNGDKQEINNINTHAIGILFVNEGAHPKNNPDYNIGDPNNTTQWFNFTHEQQQSFIKLAQQLKTSYKIADKDIVAYHEVRVNNGVLNVGGGVGPLFPWKQLADQGVGLYHNLNENELSESCQISIEDLQKELRTWGYSVQPTGQYDMQTSQAIKQLQIHHDPQHIDGNINSCRVSHIIKNLLAQHYAQKTNRTN